MSMQSFKLLTYFIMAMGFIVAGLLLISTIGIEKANDGLDAGNQNLTLAIKGINMLQASVNETQIFLQQTKIDDERQTKVNKIETMGRSNQTRVLINNTDEKLENFIDRYNNITFKLFKEFRDTQKQNDDIIKMLVNISKDLQGNASNTNLQVSKWGPENNALGKAIASKLGMNSTKILDEYIYSNKTLKKMIH